jgi:tetratricopeptide (TPR) repeat protein
VLPVDILVDIIHILRYHLEIIMKFFTAKTQGHKWLVLGALVLGNCMPVPPLDPVATSRHEAQVGIAFYEKDLYYRAEKEFKKALEHYSLNEVAGEYLTMVYFKTGRMIEAEAMAINTIKLNPGSGRAYYVLAAADYRKKNYPDAMEMVRKSLALMEKPTDKALVAQLLDSLQQVYQEQAPRTDYLKQGLLFFEREEWGRAERAFRGAIQTQGRPLKAYEYVTLIMLRQGQFDLARRLAGKVLRLDNSSAIGLFVQGTYLRWSGDSLNARPLLEKARGFADPATLVLFERVAAWPQPVYRAPAPALAALWTMAVFPFERPAPQSPDDSLANSLTQALEKTGRFAMVEAGRLVQALAGRPISIETAVEVGQSLGCRAVVVGNSTRTGAGTTADARIIEVETVQTLAVISGQTGQDVSADSLTAGLARDVVRILKIK